MVGSYWWLLLVGIGLGLLAHVVLRIRSGAAARRSAGPGQEPGSVGSPAPITRRRAIGLAVTGATSLTAGSTGWIDRGGGPGGRLEAAVSGQRLRQGAVIDSRDGRLEVELVAAPGATVAGRITSALGFNGTTPGPTLRVRPGDELALRLINRLAQPTNLHTHGLRVSPSGNSDNPFVRVEPGTSFDYLIQIPDDHPTGTFWYHPHHHGTAADQQFAGLAGALLVVPRSTDANQALPQQQAVEELILLVSDITLRGDGAVVAPSGTDRLLGRQGRLVLVNGQHQPTIAAVPGATGRWRIINACTSRVLVLHLRGHKLTQTALDGSELPAPVERDTVILAPGNRADILVRAGSVGTYDLITDIFDRGHFGTRSSTAKPEVLATLVVDGAPVESTGPPRPAGGGIPDLTTTATTFRQIGLTMLMRGGRMSFGIDNRLFDPDRDDQHVALGTTEIWTITNYGPLVHPFHLHAWPFVVLAGSDGSPPTGVAQDVVLVPARGWIRIRISFTGHGGRSVYHCHVVDHSDAGMMATVNVVT
ncbi:MAG TPA: multicopper oxidase family protein [Sporichthyaceae bacterium]|jgi:FtsP/CotA-like multicopper oxidase with cupredoxin domain|nr:multicopper oxidase family protein [Sporichthyaceae bacterium]